MEKPLTTKEAAQLRGVHQQLIIRWARNGWIKAEQIGTGRRSIWQIDRASLMSYQPKPKGHQKGTPRNPKQAS